MDIAYQLLSPFLLLLVIYLVFVLPRQRQAARHAALVRNLRAGDEVTTSGGVRGHVTGWKNGMIVVEVAPGVEFDIDPAKIESVSEAAHVPPPRQGRRAAPAGCPECGAPAGPGDQFCGDCGAPLA